MTTLRSAVLPALCIALVAALVSIAFYRALGAMPWDMRLLATGLAMAVVLLAAWPVHLGLRQRGLAGRWLAGSALVFALGLFFASEPRVQAANHAQVRYSDGKREDAVPPSLLRASGREVRGYGLHPAFGTAVVADSVVANFATRPNEVTLLFAKPDEVLLQPDGTPAFRWRCRPLMPTAGLVTRTPSSFPSRRSWAASGSSGRCAVIRASRR